ncbi:hypothetical protein ARHIZOSPH14_10590 [Agromyces rhizosphaerae]|uniref:Glucosamine kinase n=1 Tax=Agromyces rhizosphaerae TaxID=88374 RepID=A0A9W6CUR6_9MICO|nr:hypothetical protein [Agromyces rhizosphaerae]GLI26817.1 hypothetical protein ARHIZOSPH14_10590 [Agromyces rhizosphaerae]
MLDGDSPVVAGRVVTVGEGGRVRVDGARPAAGDGVGRALARLVVPEIEADAPERAIEVDQTNTSVIVGDRVIVKIVGEWAASDRSAVLLERLADAGTDGVDRLRGRVQWRHPQLGTSTLAIVTDFHVGATDGWTWAVADVQARMDGGAEPDWPAVLGVHAARLHDVLGSDARSAAPDAPVARRVRAEAALDRALATTTGDAGARLANRSEALAGGIRSLGATEPGWEFPIHGDLHVGQVLASAGDDGARRYTIIDFDGDPALPADERGRPDAAARDVAHLLVSLDLVAAVAQKYARRVDDAAWAWADRARNALLSAYRETLGRAELFDEALLPGFEAEQLAAELHYADRFLPAWRYAPDAAITHRYPSSHELPEVPWTPPPFDPTSS